MIELADEDRFLTPAEASAFVRRGVRTLTQMRAEGRGPAYHRQGSKVLYPLSALRSWMSEGMVVPAGGILTKRIGEPQQLPQRGAHKALGQEGGLCSTPLQKYIKRSGDDSSL